MGNSPTDICPRKYDPTHIGMAGHKLRLDSLKPNALVLGIFSGLTDSEPQAKISRSWK
jgi:hypothetical protein